jgi:hypothetical protein
MCADCGDFNYAKFPNRRCKGQVAVITGSRLKLGYHVDAYGEEQPLWQLHVFQSIFAFSKEPDFMDWGHRLKIHGLICDTFRVWRFFAILSSKNTSDWIF